MEKEIRRTEYHYSLCDYSRTIAQKGAKWRTLQEFEASTYGIFIVKGSMTIINSSDLNLVGRQYSYTRNWLPMDDRALHGREFQDVTVHGNDYEALTDIEWIVVNQPLDRPMIDLSFQYWEFSGNHTLMAGEGFFVLSGSVTIGDYTTLTADQFFRIRNTETIISTKDIAEILIVKKP